jgi:hypothetical protein
MLRCFLFTAFLAVAALFSPASNSQSAGGDTPPVYECSTGCYIVTCRGDNCELWFCNSGGCSRVSGFIRPPSEQQKSALLPSTPRRSDLLSSPGATQGIAVNGPVGVNTCSETHCNQFVLNGSQLIQAGSTENPRHTLRRALGSASAR